jgi:energy-coupling factor transporter ATP-binding protein EcfA2
MPERYSSAINWRELLPEKTFARTYMEEVCRDDNPENYHFWASLIAVGLAVGKSRTLFDSPEINPNLFICFTGPSGGGKSKAKRLLMSLLSSALPYSASSLDAAGVSQIRGAASGEVVIKTLVHPLLDANGKPMAGPPIPVTALVEYEEFSEMTTRTGRSGNTLKGLMMNLYGCPEEVRHLSMGNDNTAPQPFTSAITTTQIKAIRDLVDQSDIHSGFVNRWLFVTGPDKEKFPVNRIKLDLTRAGGLLKLIKLHYSGSPRALDWDEDAETLWAEFYRSTIDKHKKENPDDSTKVRIDLVMKKLFLIFMLNEKKDSLTADIVQRVIKLHPYLVSIYDMVEDEVASSELGENEEYLVEIIKKCSIPADGKNPGKGLTVSQMHDKVRRRFKVKKDLNNVVEQLTKADIIEKWELKGRVGRPTAFYTIKGTEVQNAVKS